MSGPSRRGDLEIRPLEFIYLRRDQAEAARWSLYTCVGIRPEAARWSLYAYVGIRPEAARWSLYACVGIRPEAARWSLYTCVGIRPEGPTVARPGREAGKRVRI